MADIAKVITIIGQSPESFAKAADAAVQEAAKTVRGIHGVDVISMSALVENERISMYRTTVNIAFAVER
ncbi:MAG TPA: dodecin family protein [Gaiellaceae bacterium]|jgi:dodecin|nr:dodecin family protein [Gaiellaceae bacterium]